MKKSLFDNNWVVRIVSLFFALVLFISVSNSNGVVRSITPTNNSTSVETSVTISNVPVHLGEHDEGTFVSGMPETVSVRLTGPKNIISQLSVDKFVVETESLKGVEAGVKAIRFFIRDLPESVEYKVTPDLFYGTISTKETVEREVEYQVADDVIANGYQVTNVKLSQNKVTLSGSSNEIAKVAKVLVTITHDTAQTTNFTGKYRVQILDENNRPLDINVSVAEIEASVEVQPISTQANLTIVPAGELPNVTYQYAFVGNSTVSLSGQNAEQYQNLNVVVDVSELSENGTVNGIVQVPDGITANPTTVEVAVTMVTIPQEETTTEGETNVPSTTEETTTESTE